MNEDATAKDRPSFLAALDKGVFQLEQTVVAWFLALTTLGTFADVVERRLIAPDSKVGHLLARLFGVTDPQLRLFLDKRVAPLLSMAVFLALLWFGWNSAERAHGRAFLPFRASSLLLGLLTGAALWGLAALMLAMPSWQFAWLCGLLAVGFMLWRSRNASPPDRRRAWITGAIALVAWTFFCFRYVPAGYGWGKEISLLFTLWVGFLGASLCVYRGKHIRIEAFERIRPPRLAPLLSAIGHWYTAAFSLLLALLGTLYVSSQFRTGGFLSQTHLPEWLKSVVIPVALGLASIRFIAAGVSALRGGRYGSPAEAEGMAEAKAMSKAVSSPPPESQRQAGHHKTWLFWALVILAFALFLGNKASKLIAIILLSALLALPLYVVIGTVTIACFALWLPELFNLQHGGALVEQMVSIADSEPLLAIPLFILSGAVMARGEISKRLVNFAKALVGWMPGGLAMSAVLACMIFAAISGSSPATVVAIGGVLGPAMIASGYRESFAHGLVTSAGSLGILIPPSIPMIVYSIINTTTSIRVEDLFASGYGPGFLIGGLLMAYSVFRGLVDRIPREPFAWRNLALATRDGFWSLLFPAFIFVGTNSGIFTAVEAAAGSVVYAILVELFLHRAIRLSDLFDIFQEVGLMLGSFLVILVVARSFGEFLVQADVPLALTQWFLSFKLDRTAFLLVLNGLLLVAGALMDILSAIFIFVPLIAPIAQSLGVDPLHLGIVFIVNLEIGYLTPPVGLNLFVASTLFNRPLGHIIYSVIPFIAILFVGLGIVTYFPEISSGLGRWITGSPSPPLLSPQPLGEEQPLEESE
ncbi:MAG: TRAP transporter large permease subunit, partial [Sandaracinaceae bacterium]|nr:TRAP transporter large permease subunit [Sandaracinaceae bacterium]